MKKIFIQLQTFPLKYHTVNASLFPNIFPNQTREIYYFIVLLLSLSFKHFNIGAPRQNTKKKSSALVSNNKKKSISRQWFALERELHSLQIAWDEEKFIKFSVKLLQTFLYVPEWA